MTSGQLLPSGARHLRLMMTGLVTLITLAPAGCTANFLHPPPPLSVVGGGLWAVVPFTNESGVSAVDTNRVADIFTNQLQQVQGVSTVPVNRVIQGMVGLQMTAVQSAVDAQRLIIHLDVDALVVGTVTMYDPYPPPTFGASIQVFMRDREATPPGFDVEAFYREGQGDVSRFGDMLSPAPVAQASGLFDASNHQTLSWLRDYAKGRTEPDSAFGDRIYLMDMELYTQFASYRLIHDLLTYRRASDQPQPAAESTQR